jgi:hypothetical protein
MPTPATDRLTSNDLFALRRQAAESGDCDLSLACSAALWGTSHQQRSGGMRRVVRMLERGERL